MISSTQNVDTIIQIITTQFNAGDIDGALKAAEEARSAFPENASLSYLSSKMLVTCDQTARAVELMERAMQQPGAVPGYQLELAELYLKCDRFADAESCCRKFLATTPGQPDGYVTFAKVYEAQNDFPAAQDMLRVAVEHAEDDRSSLLNSLNELGMGMRRMGNPDAAVEALMRALEMEPESPRLHYNLANALMDAGAPDAAIDHYRLSLDFDANHADAHLHLGFAYLLKGNLKRGWREMEWRWKLHVFRQNLPATPRWKGQQVDGTILLLAEQGLGDSVHFVRYAAQVAERCNRVVVFAPATLARLLGTVPGVDAVVPWDAGMPAHDVHIPMMTLPFVFDTELDTVPATVPYMAADPGDVTAWADRLAALPNPKIGLVWRGNPQNLRERMRSIPTAAVLELMDGCNASFVCLHKDRPDDIEAWPENLHHFGDAFDDVADAAALAENLDLVLSIDTLMTHLAGAMNKELWILLAPAADWRYLLDREDSPWYPSARILRRTADEDWPAFMKRVRQQLKGRFPDV